MCSSSGGQNCIIQHLVSSHSVGGRPVHKLREEHKKFLLLLHLVGCLYYCISDARSHKHQN